MIPYLLEYNTYISNLSPSSLPTNGEVEVITSFFPLSLLNILTTYISKPKKCSTDYVNEFHEEGRGHGGRGHGGWSLQVGEAQTLLA